MPLYPVKVAASRSRTAAGSAFQTARRVLSAPFRLIQKAWSMTATFRDGALYRFLSGGGSGSLVPPHYAGLKAETLQNPYGLRSYLNLVGATASAPLVVQSRAEDDELEVDRMHELLLVLRRPNRRQTKREFFAELIADVWFGGELFFWSPESTITGEAAGRPGDRGLHLIRPPDVERIERDAYGVPVRYHFNFGTDEHRRRYDEPAVRIVHTYLIEDPQQPGRGFPLATAAYRAAHVMRDGESWNASIAKGGGRMPGFFELPGRLGDEEFEAFKKTAQAAWQQASADSLPMLLEDGLTFKQAAHSPRDADWIRSDQNTLRKIGVGLGTDPSMLGDPDAKTYANFKEALRAFHILTVLPLLDWLCEEFTEEMLRRWYPGTADAWVTYDRGGIDALADELDAQYERALSAVREGVLNRDEARMELGKKAIATPEMEAFTVPINTVTLASVVERPDELVQLAERLGRMTEKDFDALKRRHEGDGHAFGVPVPEPIG